MSEESVNGREPRLSSGVGEGPSGLEPLLSGVEPEGGFGAQWDAAVLRMKEAMWEGPMDLAGSDDRYLVDWTSTYLGIAAKYRRDRIEEIRTVDSYRCIRLGCGRGRLDWHFKVWPFDRSAGNAHGVHVARCTACQVVYWCTPAFFLSPAD